MYEMDEAEVRAVRKVLLSKKLFRYPAGNQGECDRFENEFAETMGARYAVILSSGTNAIVAGLVASGIGPGHEVLVPAYTFVASAAAVLLAGAKPVVVNIDESLGLCVKDARAKITKKTKAIMPVHMDGLNADMKGVLALAKAHKLVVVEDCAQALGGSYGKKRLGALGNVGAFSLNENKNISCGEGGVVITSDKAVYEKLFCLQDLSARYNPVKQAAVTAPALLGMSMRVSEIQGAIMRVQLRRLEKILQRLRARKRILADALGECVVQAHSPSGDCGSSLHLRLEDPAQALLLSKKLMANGVMATFPTLRPAHVAWKWMNEIDPARAPSVVADLHPSRAIMMTTLKYDIDYNLSMRETAKLAKKFRALI